MTELRGLIYNKHIAHETAIFRNSPVRSFTGDRRNTTDPQHTNT